MTNVSHLSHTFILVVYVGGCSKDIALLLGPSAAKLLGAAAQAVLPPGVAPIELVPLPLGVLHACSHARGVDTADNQDRPGQAS